MSPTLSSMLEPATRQELTSSGLPRINQRRDSIAADSSKASRQLEVEIAAAYAMKIFTPQGKYISYLAFNPKAALKLRRQGGSKNIRKMYTHVHQLVELMYDLYVEMDLEQHNAKRQGLTWPAIEGRITAVIDKSMELATSIPAGPHVNPNVFWQAADYFSRSITNACIRSAK